MIWLTAEVSDFPPSPASRFMRALTDSAAMHAADSSIHSVKKSNSLGIFLSYGNIKVTKDVKIIKTYKETLFLAYSLNWK